MAHNQDPLPYAADALEPHIDSKTMEVHYGKHHAGYVAKLNAALEGHPELQEKSLEELLQNLDQVPEDIRGSVRNNGGGHYNHSLFWNIMSPEAKECTGELKTAIEAKWGSLESFREEFAKTAATRFGSGWGWLSVDENGELQLTSTANQDNPVMEGMTPIMGIDVWEHAYYLNYQNRRPDYIKAWLENVCCGEKVNELYLAAKG
jgi:superoxide dismutase, Fe-Mn family